ncbi:unnamed protein product [Durusdinium trenchii]|uniref:Katanin p80 WD40 repeat-containing subunit B1 homolog n=1 Tax=Durusdinium trenchii TaxID=1381693 RepID=A0ABP0LYM7_9DINO
MSGKRVWKQEFLAHHGRVQCARLGEKSGQVYHLPLSFWTWQVLATGGDDKHVNIWKVGKPNAMMSLKGHTSAVECLVFDKQEEVLIVGCAGGSMQCWNLEYRKMAGSLAGHRNACTCVEFHPYGEFFASGSNDTNLKIWDLRRKSCIQTYPGHSAPVSSIRFSPHGRWVATGGLDNQVKIWDLTAGKQMKDLDLHKGAVTSLAFHPKEYLLVSGSTDRTVILWSLETFTSVGLSTAGMTAVQAVKFYPEDQAILSASQDMLRIHHCDAISNTSDAMEVDWRGLQDMRICYPEEKLLAVSAEGSQLGIWVADLQRREAKIPVSRKGSGSFANARVPQAPWPEEESQPELAAGSERPSTERPEHERVRSEGDLDEPPRRPVRAERPTSPRSPQAKSQSYSYNGAVNPAHPTHPPAPAQAAQVPSVTPASRANLPAPTSGPNTPTAASRPAAGPLPSAALGAAHSGPTSSGPSGSRPPSGSLSSAAAPNTPTAATRLAPAPTMAPAPAAPSAPSLAVAAFGEMPPVRTDLDTIAAQHPQMMDVLRRRFEQTQRLKELWAQGDLAGISGILTMPQDQAVLCDLARSLMKGLGSELNLDACSAFLPLLKELLLTSKYEDFIATALEFTQLLLEEFGHLIGETRESCSKILERQLDLAREQRFRKCNACYENFKEIHRLLVAGQNSSRFSKLCSNLEAFLRRGERLGP